MKIMTWKIHKILYNDFMRKTPIRENQHGYKSYDKMQNGMALHMGWIVKGKDIKYKTTMCSFYVTSLKKNLPTTNRL